MTKHFRLPLFVSVCLSTVLIASSWSAQPESNRRMAERLRAITASADPTKSPFEFSARARALEASLAHSDRSELMKNMLPYANLLFHSGEIEAAIGRYEEFDRFVKADGVSLPSTLATQLRTSLGLTFLRWGERETVCVTTTPTPAFFRFAVAASINKSADRGAPLPTSRPSLSCSRVTCEPAGF